MPHSSASASAQNIRALEGMPAFGVRKHFVVEIVEQADHAPFVGVRVRVAVARGGGAHRGLDGEGVAAQTIALGVLAEKFPGVFAVRHSLAPYPASLTRNKFVGLTCGVSAVQFLTSCRWLTTARFGIGRLPRFSSIPYNAARSFFVRSGTRVRPR